MESHRVNSLLAFVTEVERIGDYAINVTERAAEMRDKELNFSDQAQRELQMLGDAIGEIIDLTVQAMHNGETVTAAQVEPLEETVDTICETLRTRHIQRLKEGKCQLESGIIFLDVLTNLGAHFGPLQQHCRPPAGDGERQRAGPSCAEEGHAQRRHQGLRRCPEPISQEVFAGSGGGLKPSPQTKMRKTNGRASPRGAAARFLLPVRFCKEKRKIIENCKNRAF